jgi:hypothetical protein
MSLFFLDLMFQVCIFLFIFPHPDIPPLTITAPGIRKLLDNINPHKASGPDNISGRILKDLQNFTVPILTIIFQKSLQSGCTPTDCSFWT